MYEDRQKAHYLSIKCEKLFGISVKGRALSEEEVHPYKSFEDINELLLAIAQQRLPRWFSLLDDFLPGSSYAYHHSDLLKNNRTSYKRSNLPKTMICHDYKGGYLNDRFVNVAYDMTGYVFKEWLMIDSFVYFSHYLVTVPPLCWVNAGHAHGVSVLGTIITEGNEGRVVWDKLLASQEHWEWFADVLVLISKLHKFDGYLLNVENTLAADQVPQILQFVKYLRKQMPVQSLIIWYDSVNEDGRLFWQNALNARNMEFFNACDGIFLNYNYQNWQLQKSALLADDRKHDVYVGVDVFGRGCPGAGFFSCDAVAMARKHGLSVAIFAPGWTEETAPGDPIINGQIFWSMLSRYIYVHGTKGDHRVKHALCDKDAKTDSSGRETFPWVTRDNQYIFPLFLPSVDPEKELIVVLNLQEAVITFKQSSVEKFYYQLPKPILKLTSFSRDCKALLINTQHLNEKVKFPLMIFETALRDGFQIEFETYLGTDRSVPLGDFHFERATTEVKCYVIVDQIENGNIQTHKFSLKFDEIRFQNKIVKEKIGTLLEVGLEVPPQFNGYITSIAVTPHI